MVLAIKLAITLRTAVVGSIFIWDFFVGNKVKRDIEFRHLTRNVLEFPFAYVAVFRVQCEPI